MVENYGDTFGLLKTTVAKIFTQGKRYSRKEVKEKLQVLYDINNIKRKSKHTDLYEFFKELDEVTVKGERYVEIVQK